MKPPPVKYRVRTKILSLIQLAVLSWFTVVLLISVLLWIFPLTSPTDTLDLDSEVIKDEIRHFLDLTDPSRNLGEFSDTTTTTSSKRESEPENSEDTSGDISLADTFAISNVIPVASASYVNDDILWGIIAALCIIIVVEYAANVGLFKASTFDADPERARCQCRFWLWVTSICTLIDVLQFSLMSQWLWLVVSVVLRGVCLYIGWRFFRELRKVMEESTENVYISHKPADFYME